MTKLIRIFIFIAILSISIQTISAVYLTDYYLINAGSPDNYTVDSDNRIWGSLPAYQQVTVTGNRVGAKAILTDGQFEEIPYSTALISDTKLTFVIPIKVPGWKFIRLYFQSTDYEVLKIKDAKFHVKTGYFTLLKSFTPGNFGLVSFVLEFSVPVLDDEAIILEFIPEDSKSFAFVNGIEVVSHPDIYKGSNNTIDIDDGNLFVIDELTALENIARVNVGDKQISILEDSGLYRFWDTDLNGWLTGEETGFEINAANYNTTVTYPPGFQDTIAPSRVYQTARSIGTDFGKNILRNMTWTFSVDAELGDYYMVRLHFCEVMGSIINKANQRVFNIYINGKLAEKGADIIAWTGKPGTPMYKDYVLFVKHSKQIVVGIAPDLSSNTEYCDTLLNGIEIFRVIVLDE